MKTLLLQSLLLAASLCSVTGLGQTARSRHQLQSTSDIFAVVVPTHWAYHACDTLQQKGILVVYPIDYFQGSRLLTRYEFAVALQKVSAPQPRQKQRMMLEASTKKLIEKLKTEFSREMAKLGTNVITATNLSEEPCRSMNTEEIRQYLRRLPQK